MALVKVKPTSAGRRAVVKVVNAAWTSAVTGAAKSVTDVWPDKLVASQTKLQQAFAELAPAAQKFPKDGLIRYNLACYTAQLGELETAWHWFEEAVQRQPTQEGAASFRDMALNDEDLKPLWPRIRKAL